MVFYTDHIQFAHRLYTDDLRWEPIQIGSLAPSIRPVIAALLPAGQVYCAGAPPAPVWEHVVLVNRAPDSQFDILNQHARSGPSPARNLLAIAGAGERFHGFKNRPWVGAPGNLHLSALVHPDCRIEHPGVAFTIVAVVSVLQALDEVADLPQPAVVKWVNDILIGPAKVGGVLASAQIEGATVASATMGIGLNVEVTPAVSPTPFVPRVGSVREFCRDPARCSLSSVCRRLIAELGANYRSLLAGGFLNLLDLYRSRSLVLGRQVRIHRDRNRGLGEEILSGVVSSIGDDLQILLAGIPSPITAGRLELLSSPSSGP